MYTTLNIEVSIYGSLAEFVNIRIQLILVFWDCRGVVEGAWPVERGAGPLPGPK